MKELDSTSIIDPIDPLIVPIRGHAAILDRDLARLYAVNTRAFNQAIKRNLGRFPPDFMFELSAAEQVTLAASYRHLRSLKFSRVPAKAFTEHGAIMAASVLNSPRAVEASVFVVRAFVKLRSLLLNHKELGRKFQELESRLSNHDVAIQQLMQAIRKLMDEPPAPPKPKIGFR
jgi:hypothetical protein